MRYLLRLQRKYGVVCRYCAAIITLLLFVATVCLAQSVPAKPPATSPLQIDENKYPGLTAEFARVLKQIHDNVQVPAARGESHLLPLLPAGTTFYAAMPNYGETIQQALDVFHGELKSSAVLRQWWEHGEVSPNGAKIEDALKKASQLAAYLGGEIVIASTLNGGKPDLLVIAQVRKPGLKQFLQQSMVVSAAKGKASALPLMRVLDAHELATAKPVPGEQEPVVLVRPDFVVLATDVAALRRFNARLQLHSAEFAATDFGRRIAESYKDGVTVLGAADLHKVLSQTVPAKDPRRRALEQTGFADLKYLVWERKAQGGKSVSQTELSFTGPRHGVASWLGAPTQLGGLDFVSPKAMMAVSVVLADPRQIYNQILQLASASNPNAAMLAQSQQMFGLDLKEGLLRNLTGEMTFELDELAPKPAWKAIFGVNDAAHLQQALALLLPFAKMKVERSVEDGVTYYAVNGTPPKPSKFSYAFAGGQLIAGSSHAAVAEAVQLHASGGSLGRSTKFLDSLPPGHSANASAIFYENPIAVAAAQLRQGSPDLRASLAQMSDRGSAVVAVYGEGSAIRAVSTSPTLDAGAVLVVAAIAIPNLMKSRIAANEASAVGSLRSINTAQISYQMSYLNKGFARDLAKLGSDPKSPKSASEEHAGLLDEKLGNANCVAGKWCTNSGFRFTMNALCEQDQCTEFVAVATPVASNTGSRSFCSTSEGIIRVKPGPPLNKSISVAECHEWKPIN